MRHMRIKECARVWVNTPDGQPAARGWANGLEAFALKIHEEQIRKVTIRNGSGREITVPHYEVLAGFEYRGKADWVPETDPRVLDWLESELRKGRARPECGSVERDNESRLERIREILRRNGR